MQLIIKDKDSFRFNRLLKWLLYIAGYALVFLLTVSLFDSVIINPEHYYTYLILTVLVLSTLNLTIKPILVTLTIPITGLTLGLFYPFINFFILILTALIMGPYFELTSLYYAFFFAVLLSIMNFIMEGIIIDSIIKRFKKSE